MLSFMPTQRTCLQGFVIVLFGLLHNPFKADVTPDLVTMLVAGKKGQQPGDTSVAITKRADTEEIQYKAG